MRALRCWRIQLGFHHFVWMHHVADHMPTQPIAYSLLHCLDACVHIMPPAEGKTTLLAGGHRLCKAQQPSYQLTDSCLLPVSGSKTSVCYGMLESGAAQTGAQLSIPNSERQDLPLSSGVTGLGTGPGGLFFGMEVEQQQVQPVQANHLVNLASGASDAQGNQAELGDSTEDEEELHLPYVANEKKADPAELKRARDEREDLWPMDPLGNMKIKHYRIMAKLGQGGLCTVFKAEDLRTRSHVAIKISTKALYTLSENQKEDLVEDHEWQQDLYSNSWDYRCFCQENVTYYQLGCENKEVVSHGLPQLFDQGLVILGQVRVHCFLVMSLLGGNVFDMIQTGVFKERNYLCRVAHDMLTTLEHIHSHGLVHRDVKPGNFCLPATLNHTPAHKFAKAHKANAFIIDFGFVRPIPTPADDDYQNFEGTPDYASINALNSKVQGPADDLECLAYAILEMWNGDLQWDVSNAATWPADLYHEAVARKWPTRIQQLTAVVPEKRKQLPWDEENLAVMGYLRKIEWEKAVSEGNVPKFLQRWIEITWKMKPTELPRTSTYKKLHKLIDAGLQEVVAGPCSQYGPYTQCTATQRITTQGTQLYGQSPLAGAKRPRIPGNQVVHNGSQHPMVPCSQPALIGSQQTQPSQRLASQKHWGCVI